jgi:hypothetical protein
MALDVAETKLPPDAMVAVILFDPGGNQFVESVAVPLLGMTVPNEELPL